MTICDVEVNMCRIQWYSRAEFVAYINEERRLILAHMDKDVKNGIKMTRNEAAINWQVSHGKKFTDLWKKENSKCFRCNKQKVCSKWENKL